MMLAYSNVMGLIIYNRLTYMLKLSSWCSTFPRWFDKLTTTSGILYGKNGILTTRAFILLSRMLINISAPGLAYSDDTYPIPIAFCKDGDWVPEVTGRYAVPPHQQFHNHDGGCRVQPFQSPPVFVLHLPAFLFAGPRCSQMVC